MPLVSILTLTYNHERFLENCIGSVLAQSVDDWEQIIIDDGSTDGSRQILSTFTDPRIHSCYQSNTGRFGVADTYNKALNLAQGKYIALLEGDDYWRTDALKQLLLGFADERVVVSYARAQVVDYMGTPIANHRIPGGAYIKDTSSSVLHNSPVGAATLTMARGNTLAFPCSTLIKRAALESLGGFQTVRNRHAVDFATFLSLSLVGEFAFKPEVVGYWRRHVNGANQSPLVEEFYRANFEYAQQFLRANIQALGLSTRDMETLAQHWRPIWSNIALEQGRAHLVNREWIKARQRFIESLRNCSSLIQCLKGGSGVLLALMHADGELIARLAHTLCALRSQVSHDSGLPEPTRRST